MRLLALALALALSFALPAGGSAATAPYTPFAIKMALLKPDGEYLTLMSKDRFATRAECEVARVKERETLALLNYDLGIGRAVGSVCAVVDGVEV